jgi:methionine-rich copper-binding protein CopC
MRLRRFCFGAVSFRSGKGDSMNKKLFIAALTAAAFCATAPAALGHPKLMATVPPADATAQSPQEIRLTFNEALVAKFSGVDLKDQAGKPVATGSVVADPKDQKQLVVPLKSPLAPGRYTVEWHAVSEDTHRVKGSYSFEVKP